MLESGVQRCHSVMPSRNDSKTTGERRSIEEMTGDKNISGKKGNWDDWTKELGAKTECHPVQ